MNINGGPEVEAGMYDAGPLTYRQGYMSVWMENYGCRGDTLMNDRAVVGVYTGTPEQRGNQLFRAWVDAEELPTVRGQRPSDTPPRA